VTAADLALGYAEIYQLAVAYRISSSWMWRYLYPDPVVSSNDCLSKGEAAPFTTYWTVVRGTAKLECTIISSIRCIEPPSGNSTMLFNSYNPETPIDSMLIRHLEIADDIVPENVEYQI